MIEASPRPGAPYSAAQLSVRRAVTLATGRGRWGLRWHRDVAEVFPAHIGGYVITLARPNGRPWGRSLHAAGYLSHAVDELYLIWRKGRLLATAVRWRCNAMTYRYRLLAEPDSVICPLCTLERIPRERVR